jgi:hypothetical protein
MRSKWLEWTPETSSVGFGGSQPEVFPITRISERKETPIPSRSPDTIIEKAVAAEPTKPTEPTSAAHFATLMARPSYFWGIYGDYYGWRAHLALDAICGISAPAGLIVWLGEHSLFLYQRLTRDLPNEISRAWDAQIPYEGFDALCLDLVDTYRRAAELFRR